MGELVRKAVLSCYQIDFLSLNVKQRQAIEAFKGGYISIGKLSEEMGMNVLETRRWINEHDISQNNSFLEEDITNA